MKIFSWIIGIIIAAALIYGGYYLFINKQAFPSQNTETSPIAVVTTSSTPTATNTPTASASASASATATADPYAGWKTYTNTNIGYSLKYPSDWKINEIDQYSDLVGKNVKYITISTPDGKHFLHFGLKKSGTGDFSLSDRTGIGAGEMKEMNNMNANMLGATITPKALEWQNKAKEYFYQQSAEAKAKCNCEFDIALSYTDAADFNNFDLNTTDYAETVKKILASVSWTN